MKTPLAVALLLLTAAPGWAQSSGAATPVDVELMLAVDVSYSISADEREIQRRGYAAALRDPEIARAIASGVHGRVAVAYVEWSGSIDQRVVVPWTLVESPTDLESFARRLTSDYAPLMRRTSISGVLDFAAPFFDANGFEGRRRVVDVSGDGPNNMGRPVTEARDALLAQGYAINGLPLMTQEGFGSFFQLNDLDLYYAECVIGGPFSFSIPVRSWEEFPNAVRQKLVLELAGAPPSPRVTLAAWSGAIPGGYDCLIGERIWQEFMERDPGGDVLP